MDFKSSEEAVAYGRTASRQMLQELQEKRQAALQRAVAARKAGNLDEAYIHATSAQFCREAIGAAREWRVYNGCHEC